MGEEVNFEDDTITRAPRPGETLKKTARLKPGQKFGKYQITSELGKGGMGVVYKARHEGLKKEVAIKTMIAGANAPEELIERFLREAQSAAQLSHPNIVAVHDVGVEEGIHYIVMDYVNGKTLEKILDEDEIDERKALEITRDVARALEHAHSKNIIHRDIKPANIFVDGDKPLVGDFGLAKQIKTQDQLTQSGTVLGTPNYMSPEQATGDEKIDHRSDIFSLGIVLYELLTSIRPFDGENHINTLMKIVNQEAKSPRKLNPRIDRDVETICLKMLEKNVEERYQSMQEAADDIESYLQGDPILARPISKLERLRRKVKKHPRTSVATAAGLAAVLLGGYFAITSTKEAATERERATVESQKREEIEKVKKTEDERRAAIELQMRKAEPFYRSGKDLWERVEAAKRAGEWDHTEHGVYALLTKAEAEFSKATETYHEHADAFHHLGRIWGIRRDFPKALEKLNKALEINPTNIDVLYERATVYLVLSEETGDESKKDEALKDFKELEKLGINRPKIKAAQAYLKSLEGKIDGALKLIDEALHEDPYIQDGHILRGAINTTAERFDDAEKDYDEAIRIDSKNSIAYNNRSYIRIKKGNLKAALEDINSSLEINPKSANAHLNKAWALIELGEREQLEKALKELDEAALLSPASPFVYNFKGLAFKKKGDLQTALINYNLALKHKPDYPVARFNRAIVLKGLGNLTEALNDLDYIVQTNQQLKADAYAQRGDIRYAQKKTKEAIDDYSKALDINPKSHMVWNNRGVVKREIGDLDGAKSDYEKAIEINPSYHPAYLNLAILLSRQNKYDEALSVLETGKSRCTKNKEIFDKWIAQINSSKR